MIHLENWNEWQKKSYLLCVKGGAGSIKGGKDSREGWLFIHGTKYIIETYGVGYVIIKDENENKCNVFADPNDPDTFNCYNAKFTLDDSMKDYEKRCISKRFDL